MPRLLAALSGAVLALVLLAPAAAQAQNPLFTADPGSADPGVGLFGDQFHVASTGSAFGPVRASNDRRSWRTVGELFARGKEPRWARDDRVGSPQIYHFPDIGKYVVYFSAQHEVKGKGCIGRGISNTPYGFENVGAESYKEGVPPEAGPLECEGDTLAPSAYSIIDPSLFRDPRDGRFYLLYKRLTEPNPPSDIVIRPFLDANTLGAPKQLLAADRSKGEGVSVEAPTMIFRNGRYYLFYSGATYAREEYAVHVAASVAEDNRPNGTFKRFEGNPILSGAKDPNFCGVGHQDIPNPAGDGLIFYHAYLGKPYENQQGEDCVIKDRNRFLMADVLRWNRAGGTPVRGDFWPSINDGTPSGDGQPLGRLDVATGKPLPTPRPPAPAPAPSPVGGGEVEFETGLSCTPRGQRMKVSIVVRKRKGQTKPRVTRVVFYYRKGTGKRRRAVARTDRKAPYRRTLPVDLEPGTHRVYARIHYKRGRKAGKKTISRRFSVCA